MTFDEKAIEGPYQPGIFPSPPMPTMGWDIVVGGHGGGGGYGDPIERDPQLVMKDLENGIISHRAARDIYRVAYDREMLVADEDKTKALREQERADRKKRGKKYAEFEEEWLKQKPSPEALQFYGEWPITHYKSFTYYGPWPGENE